MACSGTKDEPETEDSPTESTADTATQTTPTNDNAFVPGDMFFEGFGLYDPETDAFTATVQGNGFAAQPVGMLFTLLDVADYSKFCQVLMTPSSGTLPAATWTEGTPAVRGFELLPGETDIVDGCTGFDLPPEYAEGIGALLGKWTWGYGVSPVDPEITKFYEASFTKKELVDIEPLILGSVLYANGLQLTDLDSAIFVPNESRGYAVDDKGALAPDPKAEGVQELTLDEVLPGENTMARGYYEFFSFLSVTGNLLLFDPEDITKGGTGDTGMMP